MSFDVPHFEKVATFECAFEHDLYKNDQDEFIIVFKNHAIKVSLDTAQEWVNENCPEMYDEIFTL